MGNYQSIHPRISREFYGTLFKDEENDEEKELESFPSTLLSSPQSLMQHRSLIFVITIISLSIIILVLLWH